MTTKRTKEYIQQVCEEHAEINSIQKRFRKTLSMDNLKGDINEKGISNLNTQSPLTTAIAELKLLSASLHLSSEHEARMHSVLGKYTRCCGCCGCCGVVVQINCFHLFCLLFTPDLFLPKQQPQNICHKVQKYWTSMYFNPLKRVNLNWTKILKAG